MALSDRIALLRNGALEQIAAPREIYAHPATAYTAQFIGQTNLLRAEIRNGIATCGRLRWPADGTGDVAEGAAVYSLRPESIQLAADVPTQNLVRFRAAIKEPEELVFLFFCIAVGLALGADHPLLAFVATLVATAFCVVRWQLGRKSHQQNLLLTVTADSRHAGRDGRLAETVSAVAAGCVIQRMDVDAGSVQVRAIVRPEQPAEVAAMVDSLHAALPDCRISYVNLESLL